MKYPVALWPQDTLSQLTMNGYPLSDMTVGQRLTLNSEDDLIDFCNRSVLTEIEVKNYPFLFGLLGGQVTTERMMAWVLPE